MKINHGIGKLQAINVLYIDRLIDFLGHHYFILSLSDLYRGVEKKFFKAIMYLHYMTYLSLTNQKSGSQNRHYCLPVSPVWMFDVYTI